MVRVREVMWELYKRCEAVGQAGECARLKEEPGPRVRGYKLSQ